MAKELWKGNEAIGEAAIRAGCDCFFGYPITPQNEIPEYMSLRMPQEGRVFIQSESEISAINMVYGASASGMRAMTSSSSPGVSLKQEGISYLAGAELPAVIVNVMRGSPGLGSIGPAQGDYYQATRGGGNGDYRCIVLAPSNIQEAVDLTQEAFDLADLYRTPVLVLADGMIGQMMEPIEWRDIPKRALPPKDWAAAGRFQRETRNFITTLRLDNEDCCSFNRYLTKKFEQIAQRETRWTSYLTDDAELIIVSYGTPARVAKSTVDTLRQGGVKAGLFRPITLYPFPSAPLAALAANPWVKGFLTVELSMGQMVDDVRLAVNGAKPVSFFGTAGGVVTGSSEIAEAVLRMLEEVN